MGEATVAKLETFLREEIVPGLHWWEERLRSGEGDRAQAEQQVKAWTELRNTMVKVIGLYRAQ